MTAKWDEFSSRMRELRHLASIGGLLGWDQNTMMPPLGAPARGAVLATLAGIVHERVIDSQYGGLIEALLSEDLDDSKRAMLDLAKLNRDRAVRVPARLVKELAETGSQGQATWQEARAKDDFKIFEPILDRMLKLKAEQAEFLGYEDEPYDAHLDLFERGATVKGLKPMFEAVSIGLKPTLDKILGADNSDRRFPEGSYDPDALLDYCRDLLPRLGYDMQAGRLDLSPHPFTSGIAPNDARLTTRLDPGDPKEAILATLHEMGHGLYYLGLRKEWMETTIGAPVSFGVNESQSRLWENHVGRSLAFWEGELPLARKFLKPLDAATPESIYRAVNRAEPSLVRVQADEVTYPLHIAVRFDLELAITRGEVATRDLPAAWNEAMRRHLSIEPESDADGVLQDVHWSQGYVGYFPTYLIGSVYSAALFEAAAASVGGMDALSDQLRNRNFAPLLGWLIENIHSQGSVKRPAEIIADATGSSADEGIDTEPFVRYIASKFGELY